jgi:hypothetical protein
VQDDGSVIVSGLCTSDTVDLDDQIIDLDFSRKGLAQWAATFGNVRQMHSTNLPPAGKAIEIDTTRPDGVYLTARIVEPGAVKLVKEGVYSAFSVGISKPRIVRDKVAKQGRVTDGVFSEVSIVDFPALPTAKFNIIKRSKTEIKKLEKTLTPLGSIIKRQSDEKGLTSVEENVEKVEDTECATCKGTGKIKEGKVDCPDCAKKVENAEVVKSGKECEACKGTGSVDDAECEKCMGKGMMEPEIEKGKSDDDDEEDDDEEDDDDTQQDNEDEGDMSKTSVPVDGVAYALRRAHDAICDAYSSDVSKSAHPSIETNGYKAVLQPEAIRALLSSIAETEDPMKLASLASAVGAAQQLSVISEAEIEEAHESLNKSFTDAYPTAHPTPGSITPGQFQRPFVTSGRAPSTSTGAKPRIPGANSSIDASQFTDGPLTSGRESASPSSTGSHTPTNETAADRIAQVTANTALNAVAVLHDHIAAAYPTMCTLDQGAGISFAGVSSLDTDGSIKPIAASATPSLTKAEKKILKQAKKIKQARKLLKSQEATLTKSDEPEVTEAPAEDVITVTTSEDGQVLIDTEQLNEIVKSLIESITKEKFDAFDDILNVVKSEVDKLGSEPDPAKAPVRGTVVLERAIEKAATEADMLRKSAEDSLKDEVSYLESLAKSGNPELRMRAEGQLQRLRERVAFEQ